MNNRVKCPNCLSLEIMGTPICSNCHSKLVWQVSLLEKLHKLCDRCNSNIVLEDKTICDSCFKKLQIATTVSSALNFIGTYLTENGSTAVVLTKSAMVVEGKKQTIWVGFITSKSIPTPQFSVWSNEGKSLHGKDWNLKEAVRERA